MAFDMHTHTDHSDGTDTPTQLVAAAVEAGLAGIGITDHDTTTGWDEAVEAARRAGLGLVRGMEVSCATDEGISVHLLSYLQDPEHTVLLEEIARARDSRLHRAQRMTELLAEDFPITWDLVEAQLGVGATVGRPHIADALVEADVVETRSDAFAEILRPKSKYYVPHYAPDPVEAVRLVREAGGVPIFAHPKASVRGRVVPDQVFYDMIDAGLAGVEAYHRDNSDDGRQWLLELAEKHDLLVTGSSDYHGDGKPNRLGEHTTPIEVVEQIEAQATSGLKVLWA